MSPTFPRESARACLPCVRAGVNVAFFFLCIRAGVCVCVSDFLFVRVCMSCVCACPRRPAFAILDESSSGLDEESEALCYRLCGAVGITCLSVGHRPSLRACHLQVVQLGGDGTWAVTSALQPPVTPVAVPPTETDVAPGKGGTGVGTPTDLDSLPVPTHRFDALFLRRFYALFRIGFGDVVRPCPACFCVCLFVCACVCGVWLRECLCVCGFVSTSVFVCGCLCVVCVCVCVRAFLAAP